MAVAIKMPKMSDTMTEGVVRKWNYKVGDTIKSGDILAEVETDKATMDLENYEKGTILHFAIGEGDAAPVDGVIAIVGKAGEDFSALLSSGASAAPAAPVAETVKVETTASNPIVASAPVQASASDSRLKVSPLAKKLAAEKAEAKKSEMEAKKVAEAEAKKEAAKKAEPQVRNLIKNLIIRS